MGVGSIGPVLRPYDDSNTFLSTDAGVTWTMVLREAHKYEFGDQGGIIVAVNDEEIVDFVSYSTDLGNTWYACSPPLYPFCSLMQLADSFESQLYRKRLSLGVNIRARGLSTVQDSTSQKFILLGQLSRQDSTSEGRYVSLFLDFAPMGRRKCGATDFEKWYARTMKNKECLMGHRVYACSIKDVKMCADEHGIAMVQAPQGWCRLLRRRQVL
jgi:Sortilin, neurotensin receptor 3,/Sortilin, neurotensin receptor 3, C-terminal